MATLPTSFVLDSILSSEEYTSMGRRRYQRPSVLKTKAKGRKQWYFRYVLDTIGTNGIERREQPPKYLGWCDEITRNSGYSPRFYRCLRQEFSESLLPLCQTSLG